jgi:hypothetical protein
METVMEKEKPFCFGLRNIPSFETDDCNICNQTKDCEKENHQSVRVLK